MSNNKWFYRGREARANNRDRILPDGRISLANRQQFYNGWDEEDRLRTPKPTPEQLAACNAALAAIRANLNAE